MTAKLIIIRGNSGSGKTTIAKALQKNLGTGALLLSQDVIRREMLAVKDTAGNASIELIRHLAEYGRANYAYVIVEGILAKHKYGDMLHELITHFKDEAAVYYCDISFPETVRRHKMKGEAADFGVAELEKWWLPADWLGEAGEKFLGEALTIEESVAFIRAVL